MVLHQLKIINKYYDLIKANIKTFEIRKNDKDYKVGDYINFIVIPENNITSDPTYDVETDEIYQIIYVLKDVPQYGLAEDHCIFGLKLVTKKLPEADILKKINPSL